MNQVWTPTGELRYRTYEYQPEAWLGTQTISVLQQRWKTTIDFGIPKFKWKDVPSVKRNKHFG